MATKLDLAEAQFIGFRHGQQGFSVVDLVIAMGLTVKEWEKLRTKLFLTMSDINSIDTYFNLT